jgi:hypothetical protein
MDNLNISNNNTSQLSLNDINNNLQEISYLLTNYQIPQLSNIYQSPSSLPYISQYPSALSDIYTNQNLLGLSNTNTSQYSSAMPYTNTSQYLSTITYTNINYYPLFTPHFSTFTYPINSTNTYFTSATPQFNQPNYLSSNGNLTVNTNQNTYNSNSKILHINKFKKNKLCIKTDTFIFESIPENDYQFYNFSYKGIKIQVKVFTNEKTGDIKANKKFIELITLLEKIIEFDDNIEVRGFCRSIINKDYNIFVKLNNKIHIVI